MVFESLATIFGGLTMKRSNAKRFFFHAMLFLICGRAVSAWAQGEATAPSDSEQALGLYEKGTALYNQSKYAEAVVFFERAFALAKEPAIAYNIAKSYEKLGQYAEAIRFYQQYLTIHIEKNGQTAPDKADVEATVKALKDRMLPSRGKLEIRSDPSGAKVYFGTREQLVGQTPYSAELDPGIYPIWLQLEGYQEVVEKIVIERGVPKELRFTLQQIVEVGNVQFGVNVKGAQIFVDGKVIGITPYRDLAELPTGKHQVVISKERYREVSRQISVTAGQTTIVDEDLFLVSMHASWRSYVGWSSMVMGTLAITGGGLIKVFGDKQNYFVDQQDFKKLKLYQELSYGLGSGFLAAGLGLVIWDYLRKDVDRGDLVTDKSGFVRRPIEFSAGGGPGGLAVEALVRF